MTRRYRLGELPQRGPRLAHHEPWPGQPFSEAAFDPLDQTILRHVNTPPPQPVVPEPAQPSTYYPGDDADPDDHLTLYDDSDNDTDLYDAPTPPARAQSAWGIHGDLCDHGFEGCRDSERCP